MNNLVKQTITLNLLDNPAHPVNARELHEWLNVETPFPMWIKKRSFATERRIEEYGFTQDVDFTVNKFVNEGINGLQITQTDYFLTLDNEYR